MAVAGIGVVIRRRKAFKFVIPRSEATWESPATGYVFADKGEDLTLSDVQRDVVIRQNAGERHADMAELHGDVVQIGFPLPPGSSRDHVTKAWRCATPQTVKKPAQPKVSEGRKV